MIERHFADIKIEGPPQQKHWVTAKIRLNRLDRI